MTIAEVREKCKTAIANIPRDVLSIGILILASLASFGLGFLAGIDAEQGREVGIESSPLTATSSNRQVVVSKSGTKYYFLWCAGANRISESNKKWFTSARLAEEAGYTPASNCKGL
jgi:lipopolysaccharide export system protein LptC